MPLSDTAIKNARGRDKPFKLYDADGLYLIVTPSGGKWWRFKYRMDGREKLLSFGTYPEISLKDARSRRDRARRLLAEGIDPAGHKKAVKAAARAQVAHSFEVVGREWFDKHKERWVEGHGQKIIARLEKDIFPLIGGKPVDAVTAPELLDALRRIEARGAMETAHRILQDCGRIFRYAIATGRAERDVAADLRGALAPVKNGSFATITEPKAIGVLLRDIDGYPGNPIVRAALRLAPLVFVRPGELTRAEWAEFDLEATEWRIPAARMKMRDPHIVPLSRQALEILEDLRLYSGHTRFLFPGMRTDTRPITREGLTAALRRMGYDKAAMSVHGFRAMASTRLNEMGFKPDVIERQLAHAERNSVRAAYNHAEYLPERRAMMQAWSDYLDDLKAAAGGEWRWPSV